MSRDTKTETRAIHGILWRDWDPIGGVPEDEYRDYVWPVYKLLIRGASREDVTAYLRWAAAERLASPVPEERLNLVVDKLLAVGVAGSEGTEA